MAQISCNNLTLGYGNSILVENLSFSVEKGDYLCIVGENGSGKSTLVKTILRLQNPISGKIILEEGLSQKEIGYLPQQTLIQRDFPASVREIVLSGCQARKAWSPFYNKSDKKLAAEKMERLGISSLASRCYRELSGGQQQRVLLARALCATQKVLLLDEPVTGLDPKATLDMYEIISDLNKSEGISIIMISHDVDEALKYATHILHMGSEVFFGSKESYCQKFAGNLTGGNK